MPLTQCEGPEDAAGGRPVGPAGGKVGRCTDPGGRGLADRSHEFCGQNPPRRGGTFPQGLSRPPRSISSWPACSRRAVSRQQRSGPALIEQEDKTKQLRALEYAENNVRKYQRTAQAGKPSQPMDGYFTGWGSSMTPRSVERRGLLRSGHARYGLLLARLAKDQNRDDLARQWLGRRIEEHIAVRHIGQRRRRCWRS